MDSKSEEHSIGRSSDCDEMDPLMISPPYLRLRLWFLLITVRINNNEN